MADERTRRTTATFATNAPGTNPGVRDPRAVVAIPVRYRYESFIAFVESQSVNISRTGMFVATQEPLPMGTMLDFEFVLADGFPLLKGRGEVVRISHTAPKGLGIRFLDLDAASRELIERIIEINGREGKKPTVSMDFASVDTGSRLKGLAGATPVSGGLHVDGNSLSIQLNTVTVSYFVYNPLLNIRLGGFVVPVEQDAPLGAIFQVQITGLVGDPLFQGKGKVVAKHEKRLGIRLVIEDKAGLAALQAAVAKVVPSGQGNSGTQGPK